MTNQQNHSEIGRVTHAGPDVKVGAVVESTGPQQRRVGVVIEVATDRFRVDWGRGFKRTWLRHGNRYWRLLEPGAVAEPTRTKGYA